MNTQVEIRELSRKLSPIGSPIQSRSEADDERDMRACLYRLRVWQTENLMAPHGMDKFSEDGRKGKASQRYVVGTQCRHRQQGQ